MHLTARQGVLSLLEKQQKNPLKLNSWHPLTILNTDNKIYMKVLANRLQKALPYIIHHLQMGFMKQRHLAENLLKINEIMQACDDEKINALLVSFDFYKAFDTVSWNSLFHVMEKFHFGPKFISMTKVIFQDPITYVSNDGYWSTPIKPSRGCRQGCTFSPGTFNLVVKTLGLAIRQNENIKGVKILDEIIKADSLQTTCGLAL